MNFRLRIFQAVVYSALGVLAFGLFYTQIIQGYEYRKLGDQNRIRLMPLEAPRGLVFDIKGNLLASNRPSYDVLATPEDMTPDVYATLAKLLAVPEKEIRSRMTAPREYPFAPAVIAEDISRDLIFTLEELKPELPGVAIRVSGLRFYPYHETASHLIGYIGKISPTEYQEKPKERFGMKSLIGRTGIEYIFDDRLRGWRGGRQVEVDAKGRIVRVISDKPPQIGEDLTVTLDLEFQQKLMELIKEKTASIAVLDLKTEGLIALASMPAYDPNVFVAPSYSQERMELLKDPDSPMVDRGSGSAYPPGSIFKLVTALAALETGKITPNTRFHCNGQFRLKPGSRPFKCWMEGGHGSLNLYEAIERSCNVYFYNLGKRLDADTIAKYARILGLGERLELELSRIAPGLVPDSAWKKKQFHEQWYQGDTISFAIGQSYLLTSPLQIMRLSAIIAKNGQLVHPRLILDKTEAPQKVQIAIREENLKVIRQAMLRVVEAKYGTGQMARVDFDKIAAKTGTAQAPPNKAHSWITGFFPYENPEIAFVVFVEHGGSGGLNAAFIAKEMIKIWSQTHVAELA